MPVALLLAGAPEYVTADTQGVESKHSADRPVDLLSTFNLTSIDCLPFFFCYPVSLKA